MPLWSHRLGLTGIADVVEFTSDGTPYPVEYKSGCRKRRVADDIQLCAQALCLEEMLNRPVPKGAIFHSASKRRREVTLTPGLRDQVIATIQAVKQLLAHQALPAPVNDARCQDCSLVDACLPQTLSSFERAAQLNNPFMVQNEP